MPDDVPPLQAWDLTSKGRTHRVEVCGSFSRQIQWYVDGALVVERKSTEDKLQLTPTDDGRAGLGTVALRFSRLGKPRRATLFEPDDTSDLDPAARALAGVGGIDLTPEPGSPAAHHEEKVRAHPRRYAAIQTAGGVGAVFVPILVALLLARLAFSFDWPDWDLPDIPWPDLPNLPNLPDLPSIPWPDLPSVTLPGWLRWLLDHAKYVVPIVIAFGLAQAEIRRRRKQDELRAERAVQRREGDVS